MKGMARTVTEESARNIHVRSKEHINVLNKNDQNSWMAKHIRNEHAGNKEGVEFVWKVLKKHNKPLQRQLHEAVRIQNKQPDENLNSKSEYLGQRIKRLCLEQAKFNCNTCGREFNSIPQVKDHEDMFHKKMKCEKCDYNAFGSYNLNEHTQRIHTATNL